jgi:phosphoesterase RecJ-like protein
MQKLARWIRIAERMEQLMHDREQGLNGVLRAIREGNRFLVTSHMAQDADNVAAQLSLCFILSRLGKEVVAMDHDAIPERWRFLPQVERIQVGSVATHPVDYIFVVDTTRLERTGLDLSAVRPPAQVVNIDHHLSNCRFGDINWVEQEAPATNYLLYHLVKELGLEIDATLATCLFTGIMTDTGYFRFQGTTAETFQVAADLIARGASHIDLHRTVYEDRPIAEMRLMGHALASLQTAASGRLAWIEITRQTLARAGATFADVGSVVNQLCSIRGVDAGVSFETWDEQETIVEMRSNGAVDVGTIAQELGGGGHHNASGCTLRVDLERARAIVFQRILQELGVEGAAERVSCFPAPPVITSPVLQRADLEG